MTGFFNDIRRPRWLLLLVSIALTVVISLSVHVFMLDVLGIPHPDNTRAGQAATLLDKALSVIAVIVFYQAAQTMFARLSFLARCLLLATIYTMLGEVLLRNFIMDVVVSHDWIYCLVLNLPRPIEYFVVCALVVAASPKLTRPWMMAAAGIMIAGLDFYAISPLVDRVFERLIASVEYLDTGNIYNPPYGWQVNVPSYLTFLEPVVASFAIAALTIGKSTSRRAWHFAQFVLLIMAMKHSIVPIALYSFYEPRPLPAAILSESQFTLETLTMAILTAIGWRWCTRQD